MSCFYTFRGHKFTERQLDEFLMTDGIEFIKEFGDQVFSELTLEQRQALKRIKEYNKKAKQVREDHILKVRQQTPEDAYTQAVLGIDAAVTDSYYKPITHFLKGVRSILTDRLLMPEFIMDNYFNERIAEWKQGKFKKDEEDLLFPDGNKPSIITDEMLDSFRSQIVDMWEAQAKLGSEIHKGCQIYFSGKDGKQYRNLPKEDLIKLLRERLDKILISDKNIEQIYEYCSNLHQALRRKYGCDEHQDLTFHTELTIFGDVTHPETREEMGLIGMVDLLVVDPKGSYHIIDYKTSPHDYNEEDNTAGGYSSAKKLAFNYQLNIYDRLLYNALNLNPRTHDINVAPIQLLNFKKGEKGWSFDGLSYDKDDFIDNLTSRASAASNINDNLDLMLPLKVYKDVDGAQIFDKVGTAMGELFQKHRRIVKKDDNGKKIINHEYEVLKNSILMTFDETKEFVEKLDLKENENGEWSVYLFKNRLIEAKTKKELIEKCRSELNKGVNRVSDHVNALKGAVEQRNADQLSFGSRIKYEDQEITWTEDTFREYCNENWDILQVPPQLEAMGIVLLVNKFTEAVDVLKISHNAVSKLLNQEENRKNLTAKFESDINENSKSDSYMLKAKLGNIDLIEAMLAINLIPNRFENLRINKIQVINPEHQEGITASARELKYCFKTLRKHAKNIKDGKWKEYMEEDNFENGNIHLCSAAEQAYNDFNTAVKSNAFRKKGAKIFESAASELEKLVFGENNDATLNKLIEIRRRLEKEYPYLNKKAKAMKEFGNDNLERVYSELDIAIADLQGVGFRQQTEDPLQYGDVKIWKGHSGLMTDNPGTMQNFNINLLTQSVMNAYQIVRNNMQEGVAKLRGIMQRVKDDQGFNYFKERFGGNKVNLFKGLTYRDANGDWLMVNPNKLSGSKREFAEYFLKEVNDNRYGKDLAQKYKDTDDIRYYRVPLTVGGSMWQVNSAMETLKFKLKGLLPKEIMERAKDKIYNLLSETSESERNVLNNAQWEMTTKFDGGEDEVNRLRLLKEKPEGYFEHDLEKLLLMHMHAYESKRAMDNVLPILRAGQVFQVFSKLSQNQSYENSLKYLQNYVKVSIFNKPLLTDRQLIIKEYANKLMSIASKMALGFSPRQLYQAVEGIWKGIGLVLRNPTGNTLDGKHQLNKDDFIKSFFNTMKELGHFGNRRSLLELINEKYALNDMDSNTYAERILDDHSLIYNFNTFLFRTASRPDFYNRLTIFQTQMRADGTWDAHYIKDGQLIYDWNKDRRFSALRRGNKGTFEYNQQFELYKEMFEQMKREGLIERGTSMYDADGKLRPLPQAYTIQQSESYKALSDMIYGYYSHEKRSLMQATLIGGLTLQMYTYWSGKKNQYLAASSIKNQGKYVHVKNSDGQPLYYVLDSNGLPDYTKDPVTEETGAPVIKWQGQFSEGIIVTLSNMLMELHNNKTASEVFNQYWNNKDENLKTIYRSNMIQLLYELSMFTMLGGFVGNLILDGAKDYIKENPPEGNFAQGVTNTAIQIGADVYNASFLDLNFIDSIGSRGINWTPFSISTLQRTAQNLFSFLGGKKDFDKFITGLASAPRQLRPAIYAIFDEMDMDA